MGAKMILLFLLLLPTILALQQATVGQYTVTLETNPEHPQKDAAIDLLINIRKEGELTQELPAIVQVLSNDVRDDELIYKVDGTFPTGDLKIPYLFIREGNFYVVVDIPGEAVQDGNLGIVVGNPSTPKKGIGSWPLWLRVLIVILIIGAFWKFRHPKHHGRSKT